MHSIHRTIIAVIAVIALSLLLTCASPGHQATAANHAAPADAKGEIVADIDNSCWVIFQDKDNNHWFGSDGNGVSRYDGKAVTRFTSSPKTSSTYVRPMRPERHSPSRGPTRINGTSAATRARCA